MTISAKCVTDRDLAHEGGSVSIPNHTFQEPPVTHESPTVSTAEPPDRPNHEPSSSPNAVEVPERPVCLGFASASNHQDQSTESIEPTEGRENDTESYIDLSVVSSSEAGPRNLSSVATLTTYAAGGAYADYRVGYPFEIDSERVVNTPIGRAESFSFVSVNDWWVANHA